MKTSYKIFIAKILFRFISFFQPNNITCVRNKIKWTLNLNEGIDLSLYIFGKFEFEIINTATKLNFEDIADNSILDIGANIGAHSLQLANKFDNIKIYAVEPTNFAYNKLILNLNNNKLVIKNVLPRQVFLSNNFKNKPRKIYSSWNLASSKNTHKKHFGVSKGLKNASTSSLDNFIKKNNITNIKLIKLDVDGYELEVLKSGKNFFKKNKPYIIMEFAPYLYPEFGYNYKDLIKLIDFFGYKYFSINPIKKIANIENFIKNIKHGSSKNILLKYQSL